jgi:ATP-dependent HslUV protease ATP-binding subunit HslU
MQDDTRDSGNIDNQENLIKMKKDKSTENSLDLDALTPQKTVGELDKYIIGQDKAKRAVAIALRNRARRRALKDEIKEEIAPKNIIMIGPTGVGKTEIARRLSKLSGAPFIKVEATKYTEVGYIGRDVESMIRDLTTISINMIKNEMRKDVEKKAEKQAEETLLDLLLPGKRKFMTPEQKEERRHTRAKFREKLRNGEFEDKQVPIKITQNSMPNMDIFPVGQGMEDLDQGFQNLMSSLMPQKQKEKKTSVREARKILKEEEIQKLIDMDKVISEAIKRTEEMGIVFLDEIDKIVSKESKHGPDVSREGVQRDILPIIEGSTVNTKHGPIKTEHILFIAAGAFHTSKPSDLIPELQGRFPIRVELDSLSKDNLAQILTQPKSALVKQYKALLLTEGVEVGFEDEAIAEIAEIAFEVNSKTENIGARRLHTVMERLLDDISYKADTMKGEKVVITKDYVRNALKDIVEDRDVSRYIL